MRLLVNGKWRIEDWAMRYKTLVGKAPHHQPFNLKLTRQIE